MLLYICTVIAMRFAVVLMRRHGRPLGRHELANSVPYVGDLRIEEMSDETLRRYVRMARLVDARVRERQMCLLRYTIPR